MDKWELAAARRQAASRSKILYADNPPLGRSYVQSCTAAPSTSPLHPRTPVPHTTQRRPAARTHRFTPYSLTPAISDSGAKFSALTTNKLEHAISRGLATRTQQNYSSFVKQFLRFCHSENLDSNSIFPADELTLCAFVGSFVGEKSGGTANAAISALKAWHRLHSMEWKGGYLLSHVLKGVAALAPPSSHRPPRPPITLDMLQSLRSCLNSSSAFDSAVLAAALVAFWGQCRLGELLGSSRLRHDPSSLPSRSSFLSTSRPTPGTLKPLSLNASLHLPRTKTHQISGETVHLTTQRNGLSPVAALVSHLHVNSGISDSHHLFAYRSRDGAIRCLTREDFLTRCNSIWSDTGHSNVSGHSFRIGGTHAYLASGVPSDVVKKLGRWSSDAYLKYWRSLGSLANLHAADIIPSKPLPTLPTRPHTRRPSARS